MSLRNAIRHFLGAQITKEANTTSSSFFTEEESNALQRGGIVACNVSGDGLVMLLMRKDSPHWQTLASGGTVMLSGANLAKRLADSWPVSMEVAE